MVGVGVLKFISESGLDYFRLGLNVQDINLSVICIVCCQRVVTSSVNWVKAGDGIQTKYCTVDE